VEPRRSNPTLISFLVATMLLGIALWIYMYFNPPERRPLNPADRNLIFGLFAVAALAVLASFLVAYLRKR
jgi:hypothetical protein